MIKYVINHKKPVPSFTHDADCYVKHRIEELGYHFSLANRCEVELQDHKTKGNGCEVLLKLFVPRHVYFSRYTGTDFLLASEKAFDDLFAQLQELKLRMSATPGISL
jgi:ribosome-associated translation inhibitor RaiA